MHKPSISNFMQGVWLENQSLEFRDALALPVPQPNEALIKVLVAGICGTDLQLTKGYYPFNGIPGHEFVGEVIDAPEAPHFIGKRVAGEINIGCGHCALCHCGLSRHCSQRRVLGIKNHNGAFAEYLTLPVTNLHVIPESIDDEKAVFIEPIAAAAHILDQVAIGPHSKVLIIGAGRLGLLIAQVVKTTQCQLQVIARHEKQRQILKQFEITAISEHQLPLGEADVVIEASGSPDGLQAAVNTVKPTGSIVLKSTYTGETRLNFSHIVVNEISLIGSRCGPFQAAIALLQEGRIDPTPLISERFRFHDAKQAFESAAQPGGLKVLLRP